MVKNKFRIACKELYDPSGKALNDGNHAQRSSPLTQSLIATVVLITLGDALENGQLVYVSRGEKFAGPTILEQPPAALCVPLLNMQAIPFGGADRNMEKVALPKA